MLNNVNRTLSLILQVNCFTGNVRDYCSDSEWVKSDQMQRMLIGSWLPETRENGDDADNGMAMLLLMHDDEWWLRSKEMEKVPPIGKLVDDGGRPLPMMLVVVNCIGRQWRSTNWRCHSLDCLIVWLRFSLPSRVQWLCRRSIVYDYIC